MVVWIIGLAGAGKTTIGRELHARLRRDNNAAVFLDGDAVRAIFQDDLGHTIDARRVNAWRICRLCEYLDRQDIDVVCAILSLFPETRAWNREHLSSYFEVFLSVPMDELERRDQKGLYSGARAGRIQDVAGIDIEFHPPSNPDLVVENGAPFRAPSEIAGEIAEAIVKARARV